MKPNCDYRLRPLLVLWLGRKGGGEPIISETNGLAIRLQKSSGRWFGLHFFCTRTMGLTRPINIAALRRLMKGFRNGTRSVICKNSSEERHEGPVRQAQRFGVM